MALTAFSGGYELGGASVLRSVVLKMHMGLGCGAAVSSVLSSTVCATQCILQQQLKGGATLAGKAPHWLQDRLCVLWSAPAPSVTQSGQRRVDDFAGRYGTLAPYPTLLDAGSDICWY
jgi:hypothetical protein